MIILQTNSMCYNCIVSLSVGGDSQTQCSPGQSETDDGSAGNNSTIEKSSQSPAFLRVAGREPQTSSPTVRSASPTFRALQDMQSGMSSGDNQSATCQPLKEGEEMSYRGYTNPHKQSRSFQMLEQGLRMSESGQGVFALMF